LINNINTFIREEDTMNIREFTKPVTAKALNESLATKFGSKINIDAFTTEQLQDARNKIRTKIFNVETTESFNSVKTAEYQKNKLFLDVLNAALAEREDISVAIDEAIENINEGAEDEAELVMAAKDMVDRLTGWMEDTAEMQSQSMLELADAIRDELGSEKSEAFVGSVKPALEQLYSAMEATRTALTSGVGQLTGEAEPAMDMPGGDMGDMEAPMGDEGLPPAPEGGDDFAAAPPATGGEEEAGRARRESIIYSKKKIAETSRKLATILSKKK
jgi:hypothetical protein